MSGDRRGDRTERPDDDVARAYDAVAELYASRFLRELDDDSEARVWVDEFVELVDPDGGPVGDLGCGPGYGVHHLAHRGVRAFGVDLAAGLLARARAEFPHLEFRLGDLTGLDIDNASLGGIFSRYSIIHLPPERLGDVLVEWVRVLEPGAPVLLFFFASMEPADHGTPFDHAVTTAYELDPRTVGAELDRAGFTDVRCTAGPPPVGGRPLGRGVALARRAGR